MKERNMRKAHSLINQKGVFGVIEKQIYFSHNSQKGKMKL